MTYLIDCGPGNELAGLGQRVAAYLGPDAVLGSSARAADVLIGLQVAASAGTETWVHPRGGHRSRALADNIRAGLARSGSHGVSRVGELALLAPERLGRGAAACLIEVDGRLAYGGASAAIDNLARTIASAARSTRYGDSTAVAPGGDPMRPFTELVTRAGSDPAFRERALADPIGMLRQAGVEIPNELHDGTANQLRALIRAPLATAQAWSHGLEAPTASVEARPWGVVIELNNQATVDLGNGANAVAGVLAMIAGACTAGGAVPCAAVTAIASGYIWFMAAVIGLMNRGNGVYLTIPWGSFLPGSIPLVIPSPR